MAKKVKNFNEIERVGTEDDKQLVCQYNYINQRNY